MEFFIAIASNFMSKIGESLVSPIAKQVGYLVHYSKNINNLDCESKQLEGRKQVVKAMVDADKRNGYQIAPIVEDWLCKVDNIENELQQFYKEEISKNNKCLGGWCPNLVHHYKLNKKARKGISNVISLKEEKLENISYPTRPPTLGSIFTNGIKSFPSRISIMKDIMEKLKDDELTRIAICGMGGVGKTTFVKEVVKIVESNKVFDEVVMAVVSQNPDYKKIQGLIADTLGLKFDKETIQGRACQLFQRLKSINNVLIVLDDVWMELDFELIGIPSSEQHQGCKILLTSRNEDVCRKMRIQKNFTLSILSQDEAWDLFKDKAGAEVNELDIHPIAREVANECRGLPIAIVTIGATLEKKEKHIWEDALDQLQKSSFTSFSEMQDCTFSRIKLSYDFLDDKEAKSILSLCCLFPEDLDIPIEALLRYGVGLRLFKSVDALWKTRNHVHALVDKLKKCFMLMDSNEDECVKMHDVVRDVIISIKSQETGVFLVSYDANHMDWQQDQEAWAHSSAISLMFDEIITYSNNLDCPKLKILQVGLKKREPIPENFFQGMPKLMVLGLQNISIQSMSFHFKALDNLHTLRLEYCQVEDVSIVGKDLRKLEILSFAHSNIKYLPTEIGQLNVLRLLDLTECNYLEEISSNVFASLSQLEELYLRAKNLFLEGNNVILMDQLQSLSHQLKVFEVAIRRVEYLPRDLVFKSIVRYWFYVGDSSTLFHGLVRKGYLYPNILKLNDAYYNYIKKSLIIQQLLKKAEILYLDGLKHLKNAIHELDEGGFPYLKCLSIEFCNDLEYVLDVSNCTSCYVFPLIRSLSLRFLENLKEICYEPKHLNPMVHNAKDFNLCQCFGNLRDLKIEFCGKLKNVFSLLWKASFATLQCLHLSNCYGIEFIISSKTTKVEESMIEFPNLVELKLQALPHFMGFVKAAIINESLLEVQELNSRQLFEATGAEVISLGSNSESIIDISMPNGGKLFASHLMQSFPKLEKLWLRECSLLEMVFDLQESQLNDQPIPELFSLLKEIELSWLIKLKCIWGNVPHQVQGFQNLRSLTVKKCDSLRYLFDFAIAKALPQLQKMVIQSCQLMEKVVHSGIEDHGADEQVKSTIAFYALESLVLKDLPNLVSICAYSCEIEWPCLRYLGIDGCPQLKISLNQENLKVSLNSTTQDIDFNTSKEDSLGLLKRCLGCIPSDHVFSNSELKVISSLPINETCGKGEIESNMPILEEVQVKGLDSMDVLFHLEDHQHSDAYLNGLVNLLHLSRNPIRIMGFNNLTMVSLDTCHRLRYLFSYPIAKLLLKLQEVKISNCKMVEQLVRSEGQDSLILFPQSNSSQAMENLSSNDHACGLEWPSLKRIIIVKLSVIEVVITRSGERTHKASFAQVQSLTLSHLPNLVSFCQQPNATKQSSTKKLELRDHHIQNLANSYDEDNTKIRHTPLIDGFLFPNLTQLAIIDCNKIIILFSLSSSASLVHLKELEICGCKKLQEVICKEELNMSLKKIVFHHLQRIKLENLSNLKAFCFSSCDFEFPSLYEVYLENCHRIETFSYGYSYTPKLHNVAMEIGCISKNIWMGDLNATTQLSKGLLVFQTSKTLRWIKQDRSMLSYFMNEKELTIEGFQKLSSLIPSNAMQIFQNLKQLTVKNCDSLLEVFESEGVENISMKVISYELEVMNLHSLPKLIHIWKNLGGILGFQNLRILKVEFCSNLKNIFSPSMVRNFKQLQHLRVYNCYMIKEIISKEDEEINGGIENSDKILLQLLNKLELRQLPNLKCFYSGNLDFELPSCEEVVIEKCPMMMNFAYGDVSTPKLHSIYKGSYEYVDVIGNLNMTINRAHSKDLKVALQESETMRWIEQDEHLLGYITRLTELTIEGCEILLNCIPSNLLQKFQHLNQLKVRGCNSLLEIFESQEIDAPSILYDYKLREMHLFSLPKLVHLWKNHDGLLRFQNLKVLNIGSCNCLKSVLSPSIAKNLLQLQELSIYECEMIEEIVTNEDKKKCGESSEYKIVFPALQFLTLYRLPKLQCFCSSSYKFHLPCCKDITIKECSKIVACCCGVVSEPEVFFLFAEKR